MKYRALITGKNDLVIDDIFTHLSDVFDLLCCSARYEDRLRHIELFHPELFIICLNGETTDALSSFSGLKRILTSKDIKTVVIGREEECDDFEKRAIQLADLILTRPINAERVKNEILDLMNQVKQEQDEHAEMFEKLQEIKETQEKKHVLVIDDNPMILKLIKEYLGDKYCVATAISGKIARKFLESKGTNLILLDYEMPEENGVEVLQKIRQDKKLSNIPVIFLTGITDRERLMRVLLLKPQGYLIKPVDREKLLGTIERFIG